MKVMVIVKADAESEAGKMPSEEFFRAMNAYNEELVAAGVMLAGEGLHPTSNARRVTFRGKDRAVVEGPFPEAGNLIAGYWIWQVGSLDEAVEWLKKAPFEDGELDIRPIFAAEDFGDALPEDVRVAEERMAAELERRAAGH